MTRLSLFKNKQAWVFFHFTVSRITSLSRMYPVWLLKDRYGLLWTVSASTLLIFSVNSILPSISLCHFIHQFEIICANSADHYHQQNATLLCFFIWSVSINKLYLRMMSECFLACHLRNLRKSELFLQSSQQRCLLHWRNVLLYSTYDLKNGFKLTKIITTGSLLGINGLEEYFDWMLQ